MKTAALLSCLLFLTACETPRNYKGPSIGLNFGFEEFSVGLTLFSTPAPAAATLAPILPPQEPAPAPSK
jgi:hypothetical protein